MDPAIDIPIKKYPSATVCGSDYILRAKVELPMDVAFRQRLMDLQERIVAHFGSTNWEEIGVLTGFSEIIDHHPRLLRSLSWGDEDYSGNVLQVLRRIAEQDPRALLTIEGYLDKKFPGEAHYISAKPSERKITFAPNVFQVPDSSVERDLVAVMMPFRAEFNSVHDAIKRACAKNGLHTLRADDIWEEATISQEIFNLIFRSQVVIVDFTSKNPNVMYETGIAHTLGKHVIPITQSLNDLPSDMQHHRALKYLPNEEGMSNLELELTKKLHQFRNA